MAFNPLERLSKGDYDFLDNITPEDRKIVIQSNKKKITLDKN